MIDTWPGWENAGLIGEGSFGRVYRIRRQDFGQTYESALKVMTIPASQSDVRAAYEEGMDEASVTKYFHSFVEDIVEEFALMSQLKGNSHIVSYEDHMVVAHEDEVGWDILIRMELLTALPDYVSAHPFTEKDIVRLGIHMAKALELCRKRGILHRDIKPENIFISRDGDFKLGDFGVARVAEKTVSVMSRKGTYNYMAPEVYKGEEYGYGADIYSLGLVLYRFLNDNRAPFLPPSPVPIQYSDREKALNDRMTGKALPQPAHGSARLRAIVLKACAYRPEDRYESAEALQRALEELAGQPAEADSAETNGAEAVGTEAAGAETAGAEAAGAEAADIKADNAETDRAKSDRKADAGPTEDARKTPERPTALRRREKEKEKRKGKKSRIPLIILAVAVIAATAAAGGKMLFRKLAESDQKKRIETMLDQTTEAEEVAKRADWKESFDQRLAGRWYKYDTVYEGETALSLSNLSDVTIFETGEYYLGTYTSYAELQQAGLSLPRMTVAGQQTDWLETYVETYAGLERYQTDKLFSMYADLSDLQVTYELFDCETNPINEDSNRNSFFAAYGDDGLAVHITATYTQSAFSASTVDQTLYFYREYPRYQNGYLLPEMEGRWIDDLGNTWAFAVDLETDSGWGVTFAMKEEDGTVHWGSSLYTNYDTENCTETLIICFEDGLAIPQYTIEGYDGDVLSLTDKKGTGLTLTRN